MQSKTQSLIESFVNVAVGYGVAILTQVILYPLFEIEVSMSQNLQIAVWFTLVSLARSFLLRRFFNWHHKPRGKS